MSHLNIKCIARYLLLSLPLALPIAGIMYFDSKVIANGVENLGLDPVEIYKSHPMCMKYVHWSLVIALIFAFTPFKRISSCAAGIAIGALLFYGVEKYNELLMLDEMELSTHSMFELVVISSEGKWLIAMCILCGVTQVIYGIVVPLVRIKKAACKNTDGLELSE